MHKIHKIELFPHRISAFCLYKGTVIQLSAWSECTIERHDITLGDDESLAARGVSIEEKQDNRKCDGQHCELKLKKLSFGPSREVASRAVKTEERGLSILKFAQHKNSNLKKRHAQCQLTQSRTLLSSITPPYA